MLPTVRLTFRRVSKAGQGAALILRAFTQQSTPRPSFHDDLPKRSPQPAQPARARRERRRRPQVQPASPATKQRGFQVLRDDELGLDVHTYPVGELSFSFSLPSTTDGRKRALGPVPARWVRDSDVSPSSIDPHTRQKIHSSGRLDFAGRLRLRAPENESVRVLRPAEDERVNEVSLEFIWAEGSSSIVPVARLLPQEEQEPSILPLVTPWVATDIAAQASSDSISSLPPSLSHDFAHFNTTSGLNAVLHALRTHGLVFLRDVPTSPTDDAGCALRAVAERIGGLRNTFYGQTWDVKALGVQGRNVAYTNVDLGLHMDLLYFENPPQIQILHCLRNRVLSGGASYFVDSYTAAHRLYLADPDAFLHLTRTPVPYHYKNDRHHYHFRHPIIELDPFAPPPADGTPPVLKHVNWAPPFQGTLDPRGSARTLDALGAFDAQLRAADLEFKTLMREGELVLFDNRRVLHARTAFVEPRVEEGAEGRVPSRWLKGGYVDGDAAWDILRVLEGEKNGVSEGGR